MGWRSSPTNRWTCFNGYKERVHPHPLCYLCISTLNEPSLCKQVGGVSDRSDGNMNLFLVNPVESSSQFRKQRNWRMKSISRSADSIWPKF
jgi:hypothetical protein